MYLCSLKQDVVFVRYRTRDNIDAVIDGRRLLLGQSWQIEFV